MLLEGKTALITASGSGMGRASARRMAQEGATVIVADRDEKAAKETAALIEADGRGHGVPWCVDVSNLSELRKLFDFLEDEIGVLHVLYNHAGIPGPGG